MLAFLLTKLLVRTNSDSSSKTIKYSLNAVLNIRITKQGLNKVIVTENNISKKLVTRIIT